jgi:hypothetical protein
VLSLLLCASGPGLGPGGCSTPASEVGTSRSCDVVTAPCKSTQVSASLGANPNLAFLAGDEIFYGAFNDGRLPVLARLSVSNGQNDLLPNGAGEKGFGIGAVASDAANIYFVADGAHSADLRRLARDAATDAVALDSTETQPPRGFVGDIALVGNEVFYSLVGTWTNGRVNPPGGLYAVDKAGGVPRRLVDAPSGRGLRAFGDSLFFAYVATNEVTSLTRTGATLVRIPMADGASEVIGETGNAPAQFEVDAAGIFWVQAGALMTMPLTGGVPQRLFSPSSPSSNTPVPLIQTFLSPQFALSGGYAYVSVNRVGDGTSLTRTELLRIPLDGRPNTSLYRSTEFNDLGKIGVLKDAVYFPVNAPVPAIMSVPRCGCGLPEAP